MVVGMRARTVLVVLLAVVLAAGALLAQQPEPAPSPFRFAVFGDSRPGNREYSPVLQRIATEIGTLGVAFVVGTGDYIEGSSNQTTVRRQWEGFFTAIAPLQAQQTTPVALATGNHDIMGIRRNAEIFIENFKRLYFSFDYEGCHFIILDTEGLGQEGRITGTQLQWLKQDLSAHADAKFTFVALHRPLFPVDGHVGSSLDQYPRERDALHALFVQHGVDAVFAGHEHLYNYQKKDGILYFITGGAGAPLYASPDRGGFYHYLLVTVAEDTFTVEVRRVSF